MFASSKVNYRFVCLLFLFTGYVVIVWRNDQQVFGWAQIAQSRIRVAMRYDRDTINTMYRVDRTPATLTESKKIILVWEPYFGVLNKDPYECEGCLLTFDQSAIKQADAVVFHFAEILDSGENLPWQDRHREQRWVWFSEEPPTRVRNVFHKTLTPLNGVFNWTMSYRTDSDILYPYMVPYQPSERTVAELIAHKTTKALGAWAVSNCYPSIRRQYITELSKYIPIDIYGRCSGKPLCREPECFAKILSKYKFYFAFENSKCKDYISEKFWEKALGSRAVPVVMGTDRKDYELIAPPNSFIHIDDFDSPQSLANYLKKLDEDDDLYGEYLRWASATESGGNWATNLSNVEALKKMGARGLVENKLHNSTSGFCAICKKLRQDLPENVEIVENLDRWWYGVDYDVTVETFSVCSSEGPGGRNYRRWVTLGYTLILWVAAGIIWLICSRSGKCFQSIGNTS
ncbi:alpha-(1,3)-fucosyltransferase 7-like [Clavelina lepadiformis]|uniref:alpha-(1,3)-fucosyltransferase 7-like n=1 Tax=Clavelina lepadiformis TaxID=159417 RepID=UPI0040420892